MKGRNVDSTSFRYTGNGKTKGPQYHSLGRAVMGIGEAINANRDSFVFAQKIGNITIRVQKTLNGDRLIYIDVPGGFCPIGLHGIIMPITSYEVNDGGQVNACFMNLLSTDPNINAFFETDPIVSTAKTNSGKFNNFAAAVSDTVRINAIDALASEPTNYSDNTMFSPFDPDNDLNPNEFSTYWINQYMAFKFGGLCPPYQWKSLERPDPGDNDRHYDGLQALRPELALIGRNNNNIDLSKVEIPANTIGVYCSSIDPFSFYIYAITYDTLKFMTQCVSEVEIEIKRLMVTDCVIPAGKTFEDIGTFLLDVSTYTSPNGLGTVNAAPGELVHLTMQDINQDIAWNVYGVKPEHTESKVVKGAFIMRQNAYYNYTAETRPGVSDPQYIYLDNSSMRGFRGSIIRVIEINFKLITQSPEGNPIPETLEFVELEAHDAFLGSTFEVLEDDDIDNVTYTAYSTDSSGSTGNFVNTRGKTINVPDVISTQPLMLDYNENGINIFYAEIKMSYIDPGMWDRTTGTATDTYVVDVGGDSDATIFLEQISDDYGYAIRTKYYDTRGTIIYDEQQSTPGTHAGGTFVEYHTEHIDNGDYTYSARNSSLSYDVNSSVTDVIHNVCTLLSVDPGNEVYVVHNTKITYNDTRTGACSVSHTSTDPTGPLPTGWDLYDLIGCEAVITTDFVTDHDYSNKLFIKGVMVEEVTNHVNFIGSVTDDGSYSAADYAYNWSERHRNGAYSQTGVTSVDAVTIYTIFPLYETTAKYAIQNVGTYDQGAHNYSLFRTDPVAELFDNTYYGTTHIDMYRHYRTIMHTSSAPETKRKYTTIPVRSSYAPGKFVFGVEDDPVLFTEYTIYFNDVGITINGENTIGIPELTDNDTNNNSATVSAAMRVTIGI